MTREDFAEWVASEIFSDDWEVNKNSFEEIACRKLVKLGIVEQIDGHYRLNNERKNKKMMSKKEFTQKAKEVLLNVDFIENTIPLFGSEDFDDYEISDGEGSMMLTEFLDDFYELLFESQESEDKKCQESQ